MTNYNEEGVSSMNNAMKWGMYAAGILIVFDLLLYLTGMKDPSGKNPVQYVGFIIFIVMIVMAIKAFRESNGTMSFGQALGTGTLASLITGIILAIWIYIFMTVVDPGFIDTMKEAMRTNAIDGGMDENDYENMKGMMEMMLSPGAMAISSIISYGVIGFIVSLIGGAIMKNDN